MSERVFALLGAGEFQDWHDDVDRRLLDRADGDGRVLVLPTASAREGDEVFDRWGAMGLAHYGRLGVDVEVLPLKSRDEASRRDLIERLAGASVVFFSGGNPAYLASVLRDTPFCASMYERMAEGMALRGLQRRRRVSQRAHLRQRHRRLRARLQAGPRVRPPYAVRPALGHRRHLDPGGDAR